MSRLTNIYLYRKCSFVTCHETCASGRNSYKLLCGPPPPLGARITRYSMSVRLSVCPVSTVSLKTENHTVFKQRGEITHVMSKLTEQF